jgi:hypothetical protein
MSLHLLPPGHASARDATMGPRSRFSSQIPIGTRQSPPGGRAVSPVVEAWGQGRGELTEVDAHGAWCGVLAARGAVNDTGSTWSFLSREAPALVAIGAPTRGSACVGGRVRHGEEPASQPTTRSGPWEGGATRQPDVSY